MITIRPLALSGHAGAPATYQAIVRDAAGNVIGKLWRSTEHAARAAGRALAARRT